MIKITNQKNLNEIAYRKIKEKIIECEYPPGSMLNESMLSKELNISRTPVRESISRLVSENFVEIIPKKGIHVKDITFNDILNVFDTRIEIEPISLKLAIDYLDKDELQNLKDKFLKTEPNTMESFRLDIALHIYFLEHSRNEYITKMMYRVFAENTRIIISNDLYKKSNHNATKEHIEIIDLLINDENKKAIEKLEKHIIACKQSAIENILKSKKKNITTDSTYEEMMNKYF